MSLAACSREGSSHWTRHLNCCSSASRPCLDQPDRAGCAIRHSVRETNRHRRRAAKRTQYPFRSGAPREAGQRAVNARATTGRRHACGQKAARQRWLQSVSACWENWSGRWDSNPRPQPWQGCALPLSYTRSTAAGPRPRDRASMAESEFDCNHFVAARPAMRGFSAAMVKGGYTGSKPAASPCRLRLTCFLIAPKQGTAISTSRHEIP